MWLNFNLLGYYVAFLNKILYLCTQNNKFTISAYEQPAS